MLRIEKIRKIERKSLEFDYNVVVDVLKDIKFRGDDAVREYTKKFDGVYLDEFLVKKEEIKKAFEFIDDGFLESISIAVNNIRAFSQKQLSSLGEFRFANEYGVFGQKIVPLNRVGIYIPGGKYPLLSTVLMAVIPALVAGVRDIVLFSPPSFNRSINPYILAVADYLGVTEIYKIGGIQAIGCMAYGTETIKKVDKIFGPGNKYVSAAKKFVYGDVGVDLIAGPSETLIVGDEFSNVDFIVRDMVAQAEHDEEAIAILITTSRVLAEKVNIKLSKIDNKAARKSLEKNGIIFISEDIQECIDFCNEFGPEHLQLMIKNPYKYIDKFINYGSLFIGEYSGEVFGDYCSGTNHILPTSGNSRFSSGLSVFDFVNIRSYQELTNKGVRKLIRVASLMAEKEGLKGHKDAAEIRLKSFHLTP